MIQVMAHLLCKHKTLGSNPSSTGKKKKKGLARQQLLCSKLILFSHENGAPRVHEDSKQLSQSCPMTSAAPQSHNI
jgi:hypothetical protein